MLNVRFERARQFSFCSRTPTLRNLKVYLKLLKDKTRATEAMASCLFYMFFKQVFISINTSGVSVQQSGGSSPGHGTCVL